MKIYNTAREAKEHKYLLTKYLKVLCPNKHIGKTNLGMPAYLNIIEWAADIVVVSECKGFIGRGLYEEIESALKNNIPVKVMRPYGNSFKLHNVRDVRLHDDGINWIEYGQILT
jgi:hypothetical protein